MEAGGVPEYQKASAHLGISLHASLSTLPPYTYPISYIPSLKKKKAPILGGHGLTNIYKLLISYKNVQRFAIFFTSAV